MKDTIGGTIDVGVADIRDGAPFQGLASSRAVTQGFTLGYYGVAPSGLRFVVMPDECLALLRGARMVFLCVVLRLKVLVRIHHCSVVASSISVIDAKDKIEAAGISIDRTSWGRSSMFNGCFGEARR